MTPTREQLAEVAFAASSVHAWASRLDDWTRNHPNPRLAADAQDFMWRAYFALGEALRQTGTEPPQPAEGA